MIFSDQRLVHEYCLLTSKAVLALPSACYDLIRNSLRSNRVSFHLHFNGQQVPFVQWYITVTSLKYSEFLAGDRSQRLFNQSIKLYLPTNLQSSTQVLISSSQKLTINTNQVKCWFFRRGETGVPGENLSMQSREPTYSTHIWRRIWKSNSGHIGGRRVLSPLRHPCTQSSFPFKSREGRASFLLSRVCWWSFYCPQKRGKPHRSDKESKSFLLHGRRAW